MCFQYFSNQLDYTHILSILLRLLLSHFLISFLSDLLLLILLDHRIFGIVCFCRNYRQKKLVNMRYLTLLQLMKILILRIMRVYWRVIVFLTQSKIKKIVKNEKLLLLTSDAFDPVFDIPYAL